MYSWLNVAALSLVFGLTLVFPLTAVNAAQIE